MPDSPKPAVAYFQASKGSQQGAQVPVHFNPTTLQYTAANNMETPDKGKQQKKDKGKGKGVQFVSQSTAKLTMDLVFDTTDTGKDVRDTTEKMVDLLNPYQDGGGKVPPRVQFTWGAFVFTGIVEQYKETLEFFSDTGVPLRSSVNLTLSESSEEFASTKNPQPDVDKTKKGEPVVVPDTVSPASAANSLGDPRAARAIATASASASLRFGGDGSLAVAGDVSLSAPAAFSAGGGLGLSGGAGIGLGGGISGGIGIGGGVGAGLSVTATAGAAFSGLRASASASSSITDTSALLPPPTVAAGGSAGFDLGGAARASGGGSLSADVGATADLSARIQFQG